MSCAIFGGRTIAQTLIVDNTSTPNPFFSVPLLVTSSISDANKFTTDNQAYRLDSVSMSLATPADTSSPLTVQLWSDNSAAPGSMLGSLSGANPATGGTFTFTSSSSVYLDPNTAYWVVLGTSGTGNYSWNDSTFGSANTFNTGHPGVIGGFSQNGGSESTGRWMIFSVSGTAVPEPSTYATVSGLALVGFGAWRSRRRFVRQ